MQLINGEKQGLIIKLSSSHICVMINFGMVQAVCMLDEGIVQSNLYSENEIQKYKDNDFQNIIYEVQDGEFAEQINQISDGYGEVLNLKETYLNRNICDKYDTFRCSKSVSSIYVSEKIRKIIEHNR